MDQILQIPLQQRESEFTKESDLSVFCGTWNVNGKNPPESLELWLCDCPVAPDIYAVGFQELDLTSQALILEHTSKSAPWETLILHNINRIGDYTLVLSKQLVGMFLCIFVKSSIYSNVSKRISESAGCGIMGKMGNKGAVGIRFQMYDTSFCFINSHLSAHVEAFQRRNQDYNEICRRLVFENPLKSKSWHIFDHQAIFWLGDLNYRLDSTNAIVRSAIAEGEYQSLLVYDQLTKERGFGNCFQGFREAPIRFLPTYKYDNGTDFYDRSEKQRVPSWCDRVLWSGNAVKECTTYARHELLSSDHRPVSACFTVEVKQILLEKRREVMRDIVRTLDKKENEQIPHCTVDCNQLDFGLVRINQPCAKTVTITNETNISNLSVVHFSIIPKPRSTGVCKPWLKVFPEHGMLVPTESVKIQFTILVTLDIAVPLNFNTESLSDIMILRLENGTDIYIEVTGKFQHSCIGNSLANLVLHPKPVRTNEPIPKHAQMSLSIPKELWMLIDYLYHNALDEPGLFTTEGKASEIVEIVEMLDTGRDLSSFKGSPHSVARCLIYFLESLREPVIPAAVFPKVTAYCSSFSDTRKYLLSIITVHYNVFHYLVSFLRDGVLVHSANNLISEEKLVDIFSTLILRPTSTLSEENQEGCHLFLKNYLLVPADAVTPISE